MGVEGTPWAVNGARHSAAVARAQTYASTGGAQGIVSVDDCLVRATPTPSNQVAVMPGSLLILNQAPGGRGQTYTARITEQVLVDVPASGSSGGTTQYVWAYVSDPEYVGQIPDDPLNADYFHLQVSASQPAGNAWYRLAKITLPASTATVQQEHLQDLRSVANPRSEYFAFPRPVVNSHIDDYSHTLRHKRGNINPGIDATRGEEFPDQQNGGAFTVYVPEWASRMHVSAEWTSIRYNGMSSWGGFYLHYVGKDGVHRSTQDFGWDTHEGQVYKTNWTMHDNLYIPAAIRGGEVTFYMRAFIDKATTAKAGAVTLDGRSGLYVGGRFLEVADWTGWNMA